MRRHHRENLYVVIFGLVVAGAVMAVMNWMVPFYELWPSQ